MKCDNSENTQCDDCSIQEKCCLDCDKGNMCKNICRVQECKIYWNHKSTEELIIDIASDDSSVLNLAIADRLELLQNELKDFRESELRPATKFLGNTIGEQLTQIQQEFGEVKAELMYEYFNKENAAEELIDLQMACETMLAVLGLDEAGRTDVRRRVIEKNMKRGYYSE